MQREISQFELMELIPTEEAAEQWFENLMWPSGVFCRACGSDDIQNRKPKRYRCRTCKGKFTVRTGTLLHSSKLPLQKWVWAIYLMCQPKGISSIQLAKALGITQKSAWYLGHRIRKACEEDSGKFTGTVEADETYVGGLKRNMHYVRKLKVGKGAGVHGKFPVLGVRERETKQVKALVPHSITGDSVESYLRHWIQFSSRLYTDDNNVYNNMLAYFDHEVVVHSKWEWTKGDTHTNGIESFWSLIKRAYKGTYHYWSLQHLNLYVQEFVLRNNYRDRGTYGLMQVIAHNLQWQQTRYRILTE